MRRSHLRSFREQARLLRRQFLQDGRLPFTDVLTEGVITRSRRAVRGRAGSLGGSVAVFFRGVR